METSTPRFNYTGYGWQGSAYKDSLSTTEIAKLIRSELKSKFPNVKASIRTQYFSGGSSIDIQFKSLPFKVFTDEYLTAYNKAVATKWTERFDYQIKPHTTEYQELERVTKAIANQYNYDDSDSQIDYFHTNFYLRVGLDYDYEKTLKA